MLLKDRKSITAWLNFHRVADYTLIDAHYGFLVDVEGHLDLSYNSIDSIAVKFNRVQSNFDCSHNQLSSLLGAPSYVGGWVDLDRNLLTSLEYAPKTGKDFYCSNNQLTSLRYCPQNIPGYFFCNNNNLINLENFPLYVGSFVSLLGNPKLGMYQNMEKFSEISALLEKSIIEDNISAQKQYRTIKL